MVAEVGAGVESREARLKCPRGHWLSVILPSRLSALGEDEPRAVFLDRSLGLIPCAQCGRRFQIELCGWYQDAHRRQLVRLQPGALSQDWMRLELETTEQAADLLDPYGRGDLQDYQVRLVFGLERLRQKLALWEAGFDDRLVEVARLQAMRNLASMTRGETILLPHLELIDLEQERFTFYFGASVGDRQERRMHLTFDQYQILVDRRELLRAQLPALFSGPYANAAKLF